MFANVDTIVAIILAIAAIFAGNGSAEADAVPFAIASPCFAPINFMIFGIISAVACAVVPIMFIAAAAALSPVCENTFAKDEKPLPTELLTSARPCNDSFCLSNLSLWSFIPFAELPKFVCCS